MADEYRYAYIHEECGKVAFYYDHCPSEGEELLAKRARLLSGDRPEQGSDCVCGSCGSQLYGVEAKYIHKRW